MSSMLEQAIVDASALKEAAVKNAEQTIIEKYSADIKEAVESLLEQPEEEELLGGEAAPLAPLEGGGETFDDVDVADAATGGEDLCPCPDDEAIVTMDLSALQKAISEEEGVPEETEEEAAAEVTAGLQMPEEDEELFALEEDIEIDEELIEKLLVDMSPQMSGWAGRPEAELEFEKDLDLARMQSTEYKEENEELKESLKKVIKTNKQLVSNTKQHKKAVMMLKEKLEEMVSSNARLLYSNKILSSTSLNERQKRKIVEAISKADTVEEARVLYETLQSAVGSNFSRKKEPKSLNEALERRNSVLRVNRQKTRDSGLPNPVRDRMRKLAGIK